jgi:ring-1,2-phenylacetyl-CoA epoxidase subunit PaaC
LLRDEFNGPDLQQIESTWQSGIASILAEAKLAMPASQWMDEGGRAGRHSEHFGPLIAEMQYLQRSHPGLNW